MGFHDTYGGETNVLDGLRGPSTNTNVSLGPVNVGQSKSLSSDGVSGVKSTTVGLGKPDLGVNSTVSNTHIWSLF